MAWMMKCTTSTATTTPTNTQKLPNRAAASDTKFYSARNPGLVQNHRQEQMVDILRNATTNPPDRMKEYSFKAGGGSFAKIFDGSETVLSWDNFIWVNRAVLTP